MYGALKDTIDHINSVIAHTEVAFYQVKSEWRNRGLMTPMGTLASELLAKLT